jgi:hypothetical protein
MTKRSLEIATELFPNIYEGSDRQYHFSFIWFKRKRLLSIGLNNPNKPNAKALYFANRYSLTKQRKYPYIHSEIDAISRLFGRFYIDNQCTMVNIRINSLGELQNSHPCKDCKQVLDALDVNYIYSTTTGFYGIA